MDYKDKSNDKVLKKVMIIGIGLIIALTMLIIVILLCQMIAKRYSSNLDASNSTISEMPENSEMPQSGTYFVLVKEVEYAGDDSEFVSSTDYLYDEFGRECQKTCSYIDGSIMQTDHIYNDISNSVTEIRYAQDGTKEYEGITCYNNKGDIENFTQFDGDKIKYSEEYYYDNYYQLKRKVIKKEGEPDITEEMEFDGNGNLIRVNNSDGTIIENKYDYMGRKIREEESKDNRSRITECVYYRNNKGMKISYGIVENDETQYLRYQETFYNKEGLVERIVSSNKEGKIELDELFTYDENGNKTTYQSSNGEGVICYIEYFYEPLEK